LPASGLTAQGSVAEGLGRVPARRPGKQIILQFLLKSFYCSLFSWFFVTANPNY
jgi:hypothetical protein